VVDRYFLNELVAVAEQDRKVGLVQPKMLYLHNRTIDNAGVMCDIFAYTQRRGAYKKDNGTYDDQKTEGFFFASGACVLIKSSLLSALSGECFDPYLFAYGEDLDLSWQARLIGFAIAYCPTSVCYHKVSATFGRQNPTVSYLVWRNRIRVMIKNYSFLTLIFTLPITVLLQLSMSLVSCVLYSNIGYINSFLKALLWNIMHFRNTLFVRKDIQSKRKLSDKSVMKHMLHCSLEARSL
jgi:GT2 family glycosyltransferase